MKRTILAAVAATALLGSPALATDLDVTITVAPYMNFGRSSAKIINVPEPFSDAERAAIKAADDKWVAFCRPVGALDSMGVTRLRYAHEGCEFGRSE